ncbi:MAG: ABC transporter permease [Thermoplasmata archaeon]|nr:ABC transporter permease [Thermoplasmata archaeon]MCI4333457.1 ABC transporter permease [Thermoplasmata archaeon]
MGRNPSDLILFIGKRLVQLVPVLFGVILLTFFFTHLDLTNVCNEWYPHAGGATIHACEASVNQPLLNQFFQYLVNLLHGNWGSDVYGAAVYPAIAAALPATLELVFASLFLMVVVGIPLGVIAAQYSGRWADHLVRVFYLSGWATPTYLGAVVAAVFLGPLLGLPSGGYFSTRAVPFPQYTHASILDAMLAGSLPYTVDAIDHLILPATVLAFINMGIATRMTRASMLEVLPLDYVRSARMKGLSEFWVLYKHALRNALITTTTVLGITAGGLLSGTVVVEEVFQWPGIGQYAYASIGGGSSVPNFAGAIAVVIIFAIAVVAANLIADILYGVLDPRVDWR